MGRTACTEPQCLYKGALIYDMKKKQVYFHTIKEMDPFRNPLFKYPGGVSEISVFLRS
jgi:hypothetical protein